MKKVIWFVILTFIFMFNPSFVFAEPSNGELPQHNQGYHQKPQMQHPHHPQVIIPQQHPMFNPPVQRPIEPHMYRQNQCYPNPQYPNQMLIKCGYCGAVCYYGQFSRCPRCGNLFREQTNPQYYQNQYPIPYTMYQNNNNNHELENFLIILFRLMGNN